MIKIISNFISTCISIEPHIFFINLYQCSKLHFFFINLSWLQTFRYNDFYVDDLLFVEFKRRSHSSYCLPGTVSKENHRAEPATHLSEVHLSGTEWRNRHSRFSHYSHKQQLKGNLRKKKKKKRIIIKLIWINWKYFS